MKFFFYQQDLNSNEISNYPQILEFACKKFDTAVPDSLKLHRNKGIEFCYVEEGQYNWEIDNTKYSLFPKNASITCPWQVHGNPEGIIELGVLHWFILRPKSFTKSGGLELGKWSKLSYLDQQKIGQIFITNQSPILSFSPEIHQLFIEIKKELNTTNEFSEHRINTLIDSLLIHMARKVTDQGEANKKHPFTPVFNELEQKLMLRLNYSWTLEEMAALIKSGKTTFYNKMKSYTGFSPLSYLNQLRIKEAQRQLFNTQKSITDIALNCGFYSSQHFATTFKKVTGKTPSAYRKSNLDNNNQDIPI